MRTLLIATILGLALIAVNTSTSAAADSAGQVPASMLANLGAGDMQYLSDAQGMAIRGKGTSGGCCISRCCRSSCQEQIKEVSSCCRPCCRPPCCKQIGGSG